MQFFHYNNIQGTALAVPCDFLFAHFVELFEDLYHRVGVQHAVGEQIFADNRSLDTTIYVILFRISLYLNTNAHRYFIIDSFLKNL